MKRISLANRLIKFLEEVDECSHIPLVKVLRHLAMQHFLILLNNVAERIWLNELILRKSLDLEGVY